MPLRRRRARQRVRTRRTRRGALYGAFLQHSIDLRYGIQN